MAIPAGVAPPIADARVYVCAVGGEVTDDVFHDTALGVAGNGDVEGGCVRRRMEEEDGGWRRRMERSNGGIEVSRVVDVSVCDGRTARKETTTCMVCLPLFPSLLSLLCLAPMPSALVTFGSA